MTTDVLDTLIGDQDRLQRTKAWLKSKGVSLWGRKGWDLTDEGELTEAAEDWLKELDEFVGWNLEQSKVWSPSVGDRVTWGTGKISYRVDVITGSKVELVDGRYEDGQPGWITWTDDLDDLPDVRLVSTKKGYDV